MPHPSSGAPVRRLAGPDCRLLRRVPVLCAALACLAGGGALRAAEAPPATAPGEGTAGGAEVGAAVIAALAGQPSVRVVVYLDRKASDPRGAGATGAEAASPVPAAALAARDREAVARAQEDALGALRRGDFTLRRRFGRVSALAGDLTAAGLERLRRAPGVRRIDIDPPGRAYLEQSVPLINADDVQALGFKGEGITIATIDSGVDTDHPDLADDLVAQACFCSTGGACCPDGSSQQFGPGAAEDLNGHGTHVAGTITGRGLVAARGVAPDADLVAVKIMGASSSFCCMSDVVAGLDWILDTRPEVKAVNMSIGTFGVYPGDCDEATADNLALAEVINALRARGTSCFVASGNNASGVGMASPGCIGASLSVGSVYDANVGGVGFGECTDSATAADMVSCFSNSNTVTDLFAPGGAISASYLGGGVATLFGTSMATPHGVGCAAILYDAVPTLTPATLEANLEASGHPVTDQKNGLTFPRIDCLAALNRMLACVDADGDGAGAPGVPACPRGPVTDCDDDDALAWPGNFEVCDGSDNDCNGIVDDAALPDSDGDGRGDCYDNCPAVPNPAQANADGDPFGDVCDACPLDAANDADADGRCANLDNCPVLANPEQSDLDQDGQGDLCDPDDGVRFMRWITPETIVWDADAGDQRFDLYRGLLSALADADQDGAAETYGGCIATDLTSPEYPDTAAPPLGDGFLYVATGLTGASEEGFGEASSGAARPMPPVCGSSWAHAPVFEATLFTASPAAVQCDFTAAWNYALLNDTGIDVRVTPGPLLLGGAFTELRAEGHVTDGDSAGGTSDIASVSADWVASVGGFLGGLALLDDGSVPTGTQVQQADVREACTGAPVPSECLTASYPFGSGDAPAGDGRFTRRVAAINLATAGPGAPFLADCAALDRGVQILSGIPQGAEVAAMMSATDRAGTTTTGPAPPPVSIGASSFACSGDPCLCCYLRFGVVDGPCLGLAGLVGPGAPAGLCH